MTTVKNVWKRFWKSESGLGTLEIILIIAVVIIIALLFKDWIIELIERLMGKADDQADKIFS
ncbi:Putative Flagellin, Flp1-like, domain [Paenibacillus algorifonticola]|uniref:Putative Flagellin, Flp1-like, domain n=1 Tax=Paenibacillus algorifonticola TaxID=684063 RepID=A0A1I2GI41_9BACL|nr:Flp1 family type IVb pilin [Paenibacillus algorifonticola]SFF16406.1 Putative Flagellin, Flp1-like, domain [Paenibacillus algorifonticola]